MNRREMLKFSAAQTAVVALSSAAAASHFAHGQSRSSGSPLTLRNAEFELSITHGQGLQLKLAHRPSGTVMADGAYFYSCGHPAFGDVQKDEHSVSFHGRTETGLTVVHRFRVDPANP